MDDNTRKLDGLAGLQATLAKDVRNFRGVAYQMNWGMIETGPGEYDFSRVDAALAKVKAQGKYLLLKFQDRTFWTGCKSSFLPSYVAREQSTRSSSATSSAEMVCYARIWEATTMDNMIRVLQQIAQRYKNDPAFLGIAMEETAVAPASIAANWNLMYSYYDQLKRMHTAVHAVAPNLILNQYLNWPVNMDNKSFYQIADNLVAMGGGGAIGWPDSVPSQARDLNKGGLWYQVARDRNKKLLIIPGVETTFLDGSISQTEQIYDMLVNDIQAHMIIWDQWASNGGDGYFTSAVIPTVNKYKGSVKNTTCPY